MNNENKSNVGRHSWRPSLFRAARLINSEQCFFLNSTLSITYRRMNSMYCRNLWLVGVYTHSGPIHRRIIKCESSNPRDLLFKYLAKMPHLDNSEKKQNVDFEIETKMNHEYKHGLRK